MVYRQWSFVQRGCWWWRNRIMRDENPFPWKSEGGILVYAALAVGDHRVELAEEGLPLPLSKPPNRRRAQPPPNDRFLLFMHPLHGSRSG